MLNSSLKEVEVDIEEANEIIESHKALKRLYNNKDFKKIILEQYMEQEAIRLVHAKSSMVPSLQTEQMQANFDKGISAIGTLANYFERIRIEGTNMESSINEYENERMMLANEQEA